MNKRFWKTILWDTADRWLASVLEWIAAVAILSAFLLVLRSL